MIFVSVSAGVLYIYIYIKKNNDGNKSFVLKLTF